MDGSYVDGMNPSQSLDEDGMPYAGDPSIGPGAGTPLPRPHIRSFVMEAEASESVEAVSLLLRHNAELQDMWRFESESNKGLRRLVVQASDALDSLASQHEMFHATLSDGLATFTTQQSFDSLFQAAVQRLCTMLSADRATVFLLDETKDELWSRCAVGVAGWLQRTILEAMKTRRRCTEGTPDEVGRGGGGTGGGGCGCGWLARRSAEVG